VTTSPGCSGPIQRCACRNDIPGQGAATSNKATSSATGR
jgi:hypothetical protein